MNKKKRILKIILGSSTGVVIMFLIILIPLLMVLDFFGVNITDNYVENNYDYADMYLEATNKAIKNNFGYVSLSRILFFYLEDEKQSFYDIYVSNIDRETNKMMPISDACLLPKYKSYEVCKDLDDTEQLDVDQNKPFVAPIDFSKATLTSFFMEERIVFGVNDVHPAWDLAAGNHTPVLAVCEGRIKKVSFPYSENVTNKLGGRGNYIILSCSIDDEITYEVIYAHLYPSSSKVHEGQLVQAGDEIAGVGTTGYSTGPHLHYEVQLDGNQVDGMSLIDFSEKQPSYFNPTLGNNPGGTFTHY